MRKILLSIVLRAGLLGVSVSLGGHDARAAGDGPVEVDPTSSSGDSSQGKTLYEASCVVCHGVRASGGIGPRLANNPVLSNDLAFWKVVYEGRHVMPPVERGCHGRADGPYTRLASDAAVSRPGEERLLLIYTMLGQL